MKRLSRNSAREIDAAKAALEQCERTPESAAYWIQVALSHVTEANQWIVAQILKAKHTAQNKERGAR